MTVPWVGLAGTAAVTAGVWTRYGMSFGLITGGVLLIFDAMT